MQYTEADHGAFWQLPRDVTLRLPHDKLHGRLFLPGRPASVVLVAGVSPTPLIQEGAERLMAHQYGVLTMAFLTHQEHGFPDVPHNVPMLTQRVLETLNVLHQDPDTKHLPVAILACGPLTPACIRAAAQRDAQVRALVGFGGHADLAGRQYLSLLSAPYLALLEADDAPAAHSYEQADHLIHPPHEQRWLQAMENPADAAAAWFAQHLPAL